MKKLFAALIALVMLLTATCAFAEVGVYKLAGAQDAEGNVIVSEEFPVLVFGIDDETNACAFGTEEETVEGTYEFAETTDEYIVINVVLVDGTEMVVTYVIANDAFAIVDAETGLTLVLMNAEALAEAA